MPVRRFNDDNLTLRQVLENTHEFKKSRFDYKDRDVIKKITVEEITSLYVDRLDIPMKKYRITSYSYPQYMPYLKVKGKRAKKQRTIRHQYDVVLELESLSLDARFFWRVGSQKVWPDSSKIPQGQIKSIRRETMKRWKNKYDKKRLDQVIKRHKRSAKYLDEGDFISRKYGLNGDFYWRIQPLLVEYNMLYGLTRNRELPREQDIFFDKHTLSVVLWLLESKKISY